MNGDNPFRTPRTPADDKRTANLLLLIAAIISIPINAVLLLLIGLIGGLVGWFVF